MNTEYSQVVENWINQEVTPMITEGINKNVSEYLESQMESQRIGRLDEIDSLLESLESNSASAVQEIVNETKTEEKYRGVYCIEHMPSQYAPSWQMLSESRKDEIARSSRMYDFTKEGVLESFWSNVDFSKEEPVLESKQITVANDPISSKHNSVYEQMMRLRK